LRDISLEVNRGDLVMVIGPVGSGKSSLISAFMNSLSRVRRRRLRGITAGRPPRG